MTALAPSAIQASLQCCHACGGLSQIDRDRHASRCERCGAAVHARKPDSLTRSTALVVTAFILYVPANLYPIMTVQQLGVGDPHTILGGCQQLLASGMLPLALVVFFASVFVPLLKLVGLSGLIWSVRRRSKWRPRERTVFYRFVEAVGRWSMIDIFMLSILVALVQLGRVASIEPGIGATAFAAVVVLTMFAAESFDPRLIWDTQEETK